jgi:tol-pal system protein YbgF
VALCAGLLGCATTGVSQLQSDLDSIQQQLWKVQKENAALADQIARLGEAARAGAVAPAAPAGGAAAEAAPAADLRLRLEGIERDLQALRSRATETDRRVEAVAQELRTTREALQALVQAAPAGASGPAPAAGPAAAGTAPAPAAGSAAAAGILAAQDLYQRGYADYTRGNYVLALQELNEYVARFPSSDLADDAQYLIGEVYYTQQQYPEAIAAFDKVVAAFPGSDKAAAAYLKKGLALLEVNRTAEAVIQLQHVVTAYPRSEEARVARERLRGLGLKER